MTFCGRQKTPELSWLQTGESRGLGTVRAQSALASSSTLCRFEQLAERQWAVAAHQELVEQCRVGLGFVSSARHELPLQDVPMSPN